jgi:hypothetical protein
MDISPADLAAYLDGTVSSEERARIEATLAEDPELRRELVEAASLVATAPGTAGVVVPASRSWKRFGVAVGVAAALILALLPSLTAVNRTRAPLERRTTADDAGTIAVIEPLSASEVSASNLTFSWHAVGGASYRVTLVDSAGATVWGTSVGSASVVVPSSIKLTRGGHYYWYVDALRPDGSSLTSGPIAFAVRER